MAKGLSWNNTPVSLAIDPSGKRKFFRIQYPQVAVAKNRLYLDGGLLHVTNETSNDGKDDSGENWLLWLDLHTSFDWSNYEIHSLLKPANVIRQSDGVSFSRGQSDTEFLVFGGYWESGYWLYNAETMDWTEQIPNIGNVSQGTATVDTNQGVGYYLGGMLDETPVARLLSCNLSNWVFQSQILPLNPFTGAFLEYIPVGKKGILVFFGGKNDSTPTVGNMTQIYVYDIATRSLTSQVAQGMNGTPGLRYDGCSVVKMAPDNTSYNIYMQGGTNDNETLNDIWVLSIPSFTWIDITTADTTLHQFAHSCYSFGRHMLSTGGDNGGYETPLFYIFDLVTLSWTNSYDPGGEPYTLPAEIYSIIGGRFEGSNFRGPASSTADCCMIYSSSGNATNKEPGGGWSSPKVRDIFSLTPAPPTSSPNGSTPVGKIIGAIVGGMLVILTLRLLYWYRQRSKAHKGLHPLQKCFRIRNIPQNWNEDDLQNTLKLFACDQCPTRQLSLYPSCYDSTKTALLNLNACSKHLELPGYLLVRGSVDGTTPIYLVIDSNFHNLTPLNDPKSEIVADVIAVTGLAGHAFESWTSRETNHMWLKDLLPRDVQNIRILSYGYDSSLVRQGQGGNRLVDYRRAFIEDIQNARNTTENRPIIFIGHCLGGILILHALIECRQNPSHRHIIEATRSIMFFGTPHYGMRTDDLEKMVHNDSSRHNLLRQLKEGSELLENQLEDLAHFWEEYKLNIISVYEQVPTPSVKLLHLIRYRRNGEASEMVKRFSAQLFIPNEERVPANANHSNMVRFASAQDQTYKTVLRHLKKWVDSIDASNGSEAVPIILEARDEQ